MDDTKRHDETMKLLEEAGIYVVTGISTRFNTINRLDPYKSYHFNAMNEFFRTVDVMAAYPNTLGLFVASNLVNDKDSEKAVPVIKAVVRDVKKYMKLRNETSNQRILPLSYDAATVDDRDTTILSYLSLGDPASAIDFWTVSLTLISGCTHPDSSQCTCYIWAGQSDMLISGYENLVTRLQNAAIPIFMSQYGTNVPNPRLFQETVALYSPRMSQVFSGGCAYEFWQGMNGYGLVELIEQGQDRTISKRAIQQTRERALARSNDLRKTAEKRMTEWGALSIFYDFVNYREKLEATKKIDEIWEGDAVEREAAERGNVMTQMNWPWELEFKVPDSCVDWEAVGDMVRPDGHIHVQ